MNKFVFGFNQEIVMEYDLDFKDILLLKYIGDVIEKKCFFKKKIDGEDFYWIRMDKILESYPSLKLNKDGIRRKLKVLVEKGFLEYRIVRRNGTFPFYKKGRLLDEVYDKKAFSCLNAPDAKVMTV